MNRWARRTCQSRCSASDDSDRISFARPRSLEMRRPLSLLLLRASCPSPARGEGLGTGDLTRLSLLVQRDEGELAFRDDLFAVPVAFPRDGFGLELQRRAACL